MNNYKKTGDVVTLTAPAGGVASGIGYQIGQLFVVATNVIAAALPFEGATVGVFELVKDAGTTWSEGELLYWDDTAKNVTPTATGNLLIGVATAAALSAAVLGNVRLNGTARADEA